MSTADFRVRKGSGASSGIQRRVSILSVVSASRAASCRSQSSISDGRTVDRVSHLGNKYTIRVFDDKGQDVTPHPLFHPDPNTAVPRQGKPLASSAHFGATGAGFHSFFTHRTWGENANLGAFSRTHGSSHTSISNASTTESVLDETAEPGSQQDTTVTSSDVQVRPEEIKEELTKEDLDRSVDLYLTETETIWMLDVPSVVVSVESEEAGRILERNKIYADICKNRPGNDRFVEKMMQTINGAAKTKEVQCDQIIMEDKDLMKIKRTEREEKKLLGEKERKSEALISQLAAGMCFDFHPKDTNFYLAGTEEGHIHKCSCSSSEQFLKTYRGHKGPVYKVAWNPFSTDMFLSCSADWSIILWHQDSQTPMLTFNSTTAVVHDITWSPKSVFVFAAANESRVEIWDLGVSILNPVISCLASPREKFMSVLFATNTDCLLVGDSKGEVGVFELQNLAAPSRDKVT
ncbi:wd repeat-containing protein hypothetical protein [Limosa lapponica baueri]|uniref:Dynein axonemal intermediate chain 4 n=1 Tax=Limosa lapponica baueri TaxID=1758121 RepID=A0A2I0TFN8_LIMLA|nr:wd repeat-containing protein hypothetical protein [Limosa lapponica baueri]